MFADLFVVNILRGIVSLNLIPSLALTSFLTQDSLVPAGKPIRKCIKILQNTFVFTAILLRISVSYITDGVCIKPKISFKKHAYKF